MHAQDPVHWQLWQDDTLQRARRQNKLILMSSGYFSCHWCHVMQQENYQNVELAKFLNQHFISVKIDRELTPDLDRYLVQFSQKVAGYAGWPQHVVLTPEGYPFFAFVYLPTPELSSTLERLVGVWQANPQRIRTLAQAAVKPNATPSVPKQTLTSAAFKTAFNRRLISQMDELSGGLKGTAKFPNAPILLTLLRQPNMDTALAEWLQLTLDQMQSQHLFDHIHGGFYRYTVDPEWQTPHFEKMLYTQAQLAQVYGLAAERFQRDDYRDTARQTLAYAETHLYDPEQRLFRGSQSAMDRHHIEGGDYLWSIQALKATLPPKAYQTVYNAWRLDQPAPYEAGWHPKPTQTDWKTIQQALTISPEQIPTDTKSILGWNGLMLSAYATLYRTDPAYRQHAQTHAESLVTHLTRWLSAETPPRAIGEDQYPIGRANLQDYAFVIQGLTDWQAVQSETKIARAIQAQRIRLESLAKQKFLTPQGWHDSDAPLLPGQEGTWLIEDDAVPSPTAILACTHRETLSHSQAKIQQQPLVYASYEHSLRCHPPLTD